MMESNVGRWKNRKILWIRYLGVVVFSPFYSTLCMFWILWIIHKARKGPFSKVSSQSWVNLAINRKYLVHTLKRCIVSGSDVLPAFLLVSHKYLNGMYYLKATKKTYLSFSLTNYCFIFVWGVLFYKAL